MDYKKLADMLYPNIDKTPEYYFKKYPKRNLKESQVVSRYAPSPTGMMHIGNFFQMFISYNLTRVTDGVMFLRVEDTDAKREKQGAMDVIYDILNRFGIKFNEYQTLDGKDIGEYGPYVQSQRAEIYQTFAKYLVSIGRAFPCFCKKTEGIEDVKKLREDKWTEEDKFEYDPCRDLTLDEVQKHLSNGEKFALRLRTQNTGDERVVFHDLIKGEINAKANAKDFVLIKNDGIPPYAFAHAIDDTLMGTTIVVRGEEYISSTPAHIELFDALGFKHMIYCHNPLIWKIDEETGARRKISKRKDPEFNMQYYFQQGYPKEAVLEYLLNLINSGFEDWRKQNPHSPWIDFKFGIKDITTGSPTFDMIKLNDISKNYISHLTAEEVYENTLNWAKENDQEFYEYLNNNKTYAINVFSIDRGGEKPRKDIAKWSEVKTKLDYMFNLHNYTQTKSLMPAKIDKNTAETIVNTYAKSYNNYAEKQLWFDSLKADATALGFATNNKEYKLNPDAFKGNMADYCLIIRLMLTGKADSLDIFAISKTIGEGEVLARVNRFLQLL